MLLLCCFVDILSFFFSKPRIQSRYGPKDYVLMAFWCFIYFAFDQLFFSVFVITGVFFFFGGCVDCSLRMQKKYYSSGGAEWTGV